MDLHAFRLRRFLESLPPGEVQRFGEPSALGDVAALLEGNPKAVWFVNAGWPPTVIEYVTVALSADSTVTLATVAFVDFAIGDEPRAVITGAKVCHLPRASNES